MRLAAALSFVAAALVLAGCTAGADAELRGLVDQLAPTERSPLGGEWESNFGSGADTAYYGCYWFASGGIESVGRGILSRAIAHGYVVYCEAGYRRLELTGTRRKNTLSIEILADGFVQGHTVSPSDVDIPPGQVYVSILAAKRAASQDRRSSAPRCVP